MVLPVLEPDGGNFLCMIVGHAVQDWQYGRQFVSLDPPCRDADKPSPPQRFVDPAIVRL